MTAPSAAAPPVPITWVEAIDSTQRALAEHARAGEPAQALATTAQNGGHGRRGREWVCPPGSGLALSVLLRPRRLDAWTWLPLMAGVAVHETVTALGASNVRLKWPNDLVAEEPVVPTAPDAALAADRPAEGLGKVAGLIAERVDAPGAGQRPALVLGIGINVADSGLPPGATSLHALGVSVGAEALAARLVAGVAAWTSRWENDPARIGTAYRPRCATLGRPVSVHLPGGDVRSGTATAIDGDGQILLTTAEGSVALSAGDVVHLRSI